MGFDIHRLDPEDPFEIDDDNRPHLYKHLHWSDGRYIGLDIGDLYDVYFSDPIFLELVEGPADWKMVGGMTSLILTVPLAPPRSGDPTKCRPIGLYPAAMYERKLLEGGD
jgi:hypothetical protein